MVLGVECVPGRKEIEIKRHFIICNMFSMGGIYKIMKCFFFVAESLLKGQLRKHCPFLERSKNGRRK